MMFLYTKELFKFPVFVYMFFLYTLGNGSIVLMGSMVNIICTHFGYRSFYGSIVAAGVVILGLCTSILYSLFLINRKNQGYIMSFFFVGCVVLLVISMAALIHEYQILFTELYKQIFSKLAYDHPRLKIPHYSYFVHIYTIIFLSCFDISLKKLK